MSITSRLFIAVLVLPIFSTASLHAQDFDYRIEDGSITVERYIGPGGDVTIPDIIDGRPVTNIQCWAFASCRGLTAVTIGNGITSIGERTFDSCTSLGCVTIPEGVASIETCAFSRCTNLTQVYFEGNAPSAGPRLSWFWLEAFSHCRRRQPLRG